MIYILFSLLLTITLSEGTKDPGSTWLHTAFNPFTYMHGNSVLEDGNFSDTDAQGVYNEPSHVRDISSRRTWLSQTFREILNTEEYYSSSTIKVNVGGSVWKFSGSYDQTRTHSHNHTTMYLTKIYVGEAQVVTKELLTDITTKKLTKTWQKRFDALFATVSKISEICPEYQILKRNVERVLCIPWYAALDQIYRMTNDAGWIVSGVKLGGSASMRVVLKASDVSDMTSDQISRAITASFGGWVSGGYSSTSTSQHITEVSKAVTTVDMSLIGGEGVFNDSFSDFLNWEKSLSLYPDVFGINLVPLYSLVTLDRFPNYDPWLVEFVASEIKFAYEKLIEMNTPLGCNSFTDQNFNPNSFSYGGCNTNSNYSFGGFVQTSFSSNPNDPLMTCQPNVTFSPTSICPPNWRFVSLTGNLSFPEYINEPDYNYRGDFFGGKFFPCRINIHWSLCRWDQVSYNCVTNTGFCTKENSTINDSFNLLFGGIYSNQEPNPVTGSPSCPPGFNSVSLMNGFLTGCQKFVGDENDKYGVPYGGLYSGTSNNPMTNQSSCPSGYSRYFLGTLSGIPWYSCMVYLSSYLKPNFKYLPHLISPDYIISYNNKTVFLTQKYSVNEQIYKSNDDWKIYVPILVTFFVLLISGIAFYIYRKKNQTRNYYNIDIEAVETSRGYLIPGKSKFVNLDGYDGYTEI